MVCEMKITPEETKLEHYTPLPPIHLIIRYMPIPLSQILGRPLNTTMNLKLKFRQYSAMQTNRMLYHCTT